MPAILAASIELNSLRLNSGGPATIGANMLHESYQRKPSQSPISPYFDIINLLIFTLELK